MRAFTQDHEFFVNGNYVAVWIPGDVHTEQLGFFDSLNEKADNRYGVMVHFSEIEANTPAIWRPVNGGFGASIVNSF